MIVPRETPSVNSPLFDGLAAHINETLIGQLRATRTGATPVLRLDQAHFLYLTKEQACLYLAAVDTPEYHGSLYGPYAAILDDIKYRILAGFEHECAFIDLGPGTADRSLPLLTTLRDSGHALIYVPVDISSHFLSVAASAVANLGIEVEPLPALFADVPRLMAGRPNLSRGYRRFVNIGFTFNNFDPDQILPLLREIARPDGRVLIATELTDHLASSALVRPYQHPRAAAFNFGVLAMAGIHQDDCAYFAEFTANRVEMGFRCCRPVTLADSAIIPADARIVTSVSYRYSRESLLCTLARYCSDVNFFGGDSSAVALATFAP